MGRLHDLFASINRKIRMNGRKDISGELLNGVLNDIVSSLSKYYQFAGVAKPDSQRFDSDEGIFYLAAEKGTYLDFGSLVLSEGEFAALVYDGKEWKKIPISVITSQGLQVWGKSKQDVIADLNVIRNGASLGATAIQDIKTINGISLVGKGNVKIDVVYKEDYDATIKALRETLALKLDKSVHESYVSKTDKAISQKVDKTTFDAAISNVNGFLASLGVTIQSLSKQVQELNARVAALEGDDKTSNIIGTAKVGYALLG